MGWALQHLRDRPAHLAIAAVAGGLAVAPCPWWALPALAAVAAGVPIGLDRRRLSMPLVVLVLAGGLVGQLRLDALGLSSVPGPGFVEAGAVLVEAPRESQFGASAEVEIVSGPLQGRHLLASARAAGVWPDAARQGAVLAVRGTVGVPPAPEPGGFDRRAWLRRSGMSAELRVTSIEATGKQRGGLAGVVDAMRTRAEDAIDAGLSAPQAALLRGMVLGEDERISTIMRDDFRRSGLAHLLAVSGQNVMLLGMLALPLLVAARARPSTRVGVLVALIAVYVPLAGAGPSLQRAGVMGVAGLAALAAGRPESRWYSLLLAAAATLALNPLAAGDPGWQLSFAAVAGIVTLAPAVRRRLTALPHPVAEGVAMTVAATLATAPLMAAHFEAVSPAALPANILALPAVAPVMWLGMLAVAAGQIAALGPAFEWAADGLAGTLGWLAAVPLDYLSGLASWFASLSGAQLDVPALSPGGVFAAFGLLGACLLAVARVSRRTGARAAAIAGSVRMLGRSQRAALVIAGVGLACLASLPLVEAPDPPRDLTVRFLDVGQGDATLIQDPSGAAVLFDGGHEDARVAALLRQAGVSRLALVVATHQSADHHGGLAEVLTRYPVDMLLENGDGTADPTFLAMLDAARLAGVPITTARAGQILRVGGLVVRVLWPPPRPPGPAPEDPNPRAMVAIVSAGEFDLFLSADAESPTLLPLDLPPVEAMKVPHHGSSDPGLPELLTRLQPSIAAIEVGADNTYGHPHPSTLAALRAAAVRVYRTDRDGTVSLTVAGGAMIVDTYR